MSYAIKQVKVVYSCCTWTNASSNVVHRRLIAIGRVSVRAFHSHQRSLRLSSRMAKLILPIRITRRRINESNKQETQVTVEYSCCTQDIYQLECPPAIAHSHTQGIHAHAPPASAVYLRLSASSSHCSKRACLACRSISASRREHQHQNPPSECTTKTATSPD